MAQELKITCQHCGSDVDISVIKWHKDKENVDTYFPFLIKIEKGKRMICYSLTMDLPGGVPFTVLEVNCDIETPTTVSG